MTPPSAGELSHDDGPEARKAMMLTSQNEVRLPRPRNREAYETGDRMMGVEEDGHEYRNDDESDIGDEVSDSTIHQGSEAGDVLMDGEDVSPKSSRSRRL